MLTELASHNGDIRRLLERGYALAAEEGFLIVRDIPYLDEQMNAQVGAFVAKLVPIDRHRVTQDDHQIYFTGGSPYGLDGKLIPNLAGGPHSMPVGRNDILVQRSFSNKPQSGAFTDFYEKIEHYTNLVAGPAMERDNANPYTFRVDERVLNPSVFKFKDSLTSRAEIGDLVQPLRKDVVAIIGLGGTGAYLLDFFTKTPVKEIRAFDGDFFHVHNAFRSPGALDEAELGTRKADVYQRRYDNFREGIHIAAKMIDTSCADDFVGVTFAFICVDKGSARKEIMSLLIELDIPFIDVGMGLNRISGGLTGMLRTTYFGNECAETVRKKQLTEEADAPDDEYRKNIQISELNAMNACIAIMAYKKLRGFYADDRPVYHAIFQIDDFRLFVEEGHGPDSA